MNAVTKYRGTLQYMSNCFRTFEESAKFKKASKQVKIRDQ